MRPKSFSPARVAGLLVVMASGMFLAGCGSGGTGNNIALPVITLSPAAASVQAGAQLQFIATIVSPSSTTVTWSVNNVLGGNAAVGTISTSGLYVAPSTVPSPATVSIKATSPAESNPFGSAIVTITPSTAKVTVSISPSASSLATGSTLQFSAGVAGTSNASIQWSVNGIAGGSSAVGNINSSGLYTAPATVPSPAMVTITATSVFQPASSSSASVTITAPTMQVSVSPSSTSIWAGSTVQFAATAPAIAGATFQWSANGIVGGNSTIGTICNPGVAACTSPGLYTAPASAPNPATVAITANVLVNNVASGSGSASVTFTPPVVEGIAPGGASVVEGTTSQFTANTIPANSADVQWWVNGVVGGNSTSGTISTSGLYTAPTALPSPSTVVVSVTGEAEANDSAFTTLTLTAANSAPLYVNFGPDGNSGNSSTAPYNGLYTTITVCLPGTQDCQTIPNILVDTQTVGLRLLDSVLTAVPATELGVVSSSSGFQVQECTQFPDASYLWGTVLTADVVISGERASNVAIQVINDNALPVPTSDCLTLGSGQSLTTVAELGANGILGIGTSVQDCGQNCAGGQTFSGYPYYVCPNGVCQTVPVPVAQQVSNPVAFFTNDNNGVEIVLPSIPPTGAPSLPYLNADGTGLIPAGQLIFGVGTQSNNALGGATIYTLDSNGNFPGVIYNGTTYNSGGSLDTAANALYLANPVTLGVPVCADNPYYCPGSATPISLTINGANGTSEAVMLNVDNADILFTGNPDYSAFNDLAKPTIPGLLTDSFDLGLPFFFGRSVFVGIVGAIPGGGSAPYGYFAF